MRPGVPFVRGFAGNVRFAPSSIREHKLRSTLTDPRDRGGRDHGHGDGGHRHRLQQQRDRQPPDVRRQPHRDPEVRGPLRPRRPAERRGEAPEEPDHRGRGRRCARCSRTRRWRVLYAYTDAVVHVKNGNLEANGPYILGERRVLSHRAPPTEHRPRALLHAHGGAAPRARRGAGRGGAGGHLPQGRSDRQGHHGRRACATASSACWRRRGRSSASRPTTRSSLPYAAFERQFGFRAQRDGVNLNIVPQAHGGHGPAVIEKAVAVLRARRTRALQQAQRLRGRHARPAHLAVPGHHGRHHRGHGLRGPHLARHRRRRA